jgi:hypothetical protein
MDERTKDRLEELQAEIRLETGENVTQQELLDRIVTDAYDSKEELIDSFRDDEWEGLSEEEIERFMSGTTASGDPVDEDEIDDVLYGSPDEFADGDEWAPSWIRASGTPTTIGMRPVTRAPQGPSKLSSRAGMGPSSPAITSSTRPSR